MGWLTLHETLGAPDPPILSPFLGTPSGLAELSTVMIIYVYSATWHSAGSLMECYIHFIGFLVKLQGIKFREQFSLL